VFKDIEEKTTAMQVLSTTVLEIIKTAEEIVLMPMEDERLVAWALFLDELGIKPELLI